MAQKKQLPPLTEQEIRELIHTMIKRMILAAVVLCGAGLLIVCLMIFFGANS